QRQLRGLDIDLIGRIGDVCNLWIGRLCCGLSKTTAGEEANGGYCHADLDEDADKHGDLPTRRRISSPKCTKCAIEHLLGWGHEAKGSRFFVIFTRNPAAGCFVPQTQF